MFSISNEFLPHAKVYGMLEYLLDNELVFSELGVPFSFTGFRFPIDDEKFHWVGDTGGGKVLDSLFEKYQIHRNSEGIPFRAGIWP